MSKLNVYVALDRSGSMSGRWAEAFETINEYVNGLKGGKVEGKITVVAFDSDSNSKVDLVTMVDSESIPYFTPLNPKGDIQPRGMTPLYDAAAMVMNKALSESPERAVVAIMTDGHENSSREYTQASIKAKVAELTKKGYEVLFLGANFDVTTYTQSAGLDMTKMRSVNLMDVGERKNLYNDLSARTTAYAMTGAAIDMSVKSEDK